MPPVETAKLVAEVGALTVGFGMFVWLVVEIVKFVQGITAYAKTFVTNHMTHIEEDVKGIKEGMHETKDAIKDLTHTIKEHLLKE